MTAIISAMAANMRAILKAIELLCSAVCTSSYLPSLDDS